MVTSLGSLDIRAGKFGESELRMRVGLAKYHAPNLGLDKWPSFGFGLIVWPRRQFKPQLGRIPNASCECLANALLSAFLKQSSKGVQCKSSPAS